MARKVLKYIGGTLQHRVIQQNPGSLSNLILNISLVYQEGADSAHAEGKINIPRGAILVQIPL